MGAGRLEGRVAFVTGGARGQGRAIAAKLASEGAEIVICDICRPIGVVPYPLAGTADLDATRELIERAGRNCIAEIADVRSPDALTAVAEKALATFGRIDILCGNAGIASFGSALELSQEAWDEVIAVNLTGVWNSVRAVAPAMIRQRGGSIILTSSINGHEPAPDLAHYVAAKHGVLGLMRQFAYEFGPEGVRVNAIMPGPMLTPMMNNPRSLEWVMQRPNATVHDVLDATRSWTALRGRTAMPATVVADAVVWLASDESRHVTGVGLPVDAGHSILPGTNPAPVVDEAFTMADFADTALGVVPVAATSR